MPFLNTLDRSLRFFLHLLTKGYQLLLSPFFAPSCRFSPTCSQYAIDALKEKNLFVSTKLIFFRIIKCHPFNSGGYDPVE
ncbi:membrane protein insertion efficiency factor YidD [bacterium]|nr:membrane protein insertion efficiency factor YidD [bacterium]